MTKEADSARLIEVIRERAPDARCPLCYTPNFTLADGSVNLMVTPAPVSGTLPIVTESLPTVVLICQNCGNTLLLNLIVLGLQDLFTPPAVTVVPITASIQAHGALAAELVHVKDTPGGGSSTATDKVHIRDEPRI